MSVTLYAFFRMDSRVWSGRGEGLGQCKDPSGVTGQVVLPTFERVVGHGVQADVNQVGQQPVIKIGRGAVRAVPVLAQLAADVDVVPGGEPGPPVDEPGCVVQVVPIQGIASVNDGGDPGAFGQDVPVR